MIIFIFSKLRTLNLREMEIADISGGPEVAKLCPNIEFLDVAENLICSWKDIFEFSKHFSKLKSSDIRLGIILEYSALHD